MRHRVVGSVCLMLAAVAGAQPVAVPASAPSAAPWWQSAVFYEIFVRSFNDSRSGPLANDGIGDFQGLIDRLDYLNDGRPDTDSDLGINAIWLMPIKESRSYHGYDVDDYYATEKDFGTNADFKRLVEQCHRRGIKVIIDLVLNHASKENAWFKESLDPKSPKHDWFLWRETPPAWKGPWNQEVWHKVATPAGDRYYYGLFSSYMPDLNYDHRAVSDEMLAVTRHWITEYKIDGYRLDAIKYLDEDGTTLENTPETHAWLRKFHAEYTKADPNAFAVGEVWDSAKVASSYVGDQLDACFEFSLADAMIASARESNHERIAKAQREVMGLYPPGRYGRFLSNHDQTRVMTQLKGDAGAMRSAAAMLLLGPGVPFIYYGEEIGMIGDKPDERLRSPMQWTPGEQAGFSTKKAWEALQPDAASTNVERQSSDPDSLLNCYKKLIRVRLSHPALARGDLIPMESGAKEIIAFLRTSEVGGIRESAIVVINLRKDAATNLALTLDSSPLRNAKSAREVLRGEKTPAPTLDATGGFKNYRPVERLPAHGAAVVILEP